MAHVKLSQDLQKESCQSLAIQNPSLVAGVILNKETLLKKLKD